LAIAQEFPDHVVKIIVPTAPGGAIDTTARVIGEKMQAKWGKPVVIENRPGASMQVGAEAVAKSALRANVRFWHKADIPIQLVNVCFRVQSTHEQTARRSASEVPDWLLSAALRRRMSEIAA